MKNKLFFLLIFIFMVVELCVSLPLSVWSQYSLASSAQKHCNSSGVFWTNRNLFCCVVNFFLSFWLSFPSLVLPSAATTLSLCTLSWQTSEPIHFPPSPTLWSSSSPQFFAFSFFWFLFLLLSRLFFFSSSTSSSFSLSSYSFSSAILVCWCLLRSNCDGFSFLTDFLLLSSSSSSRLFSFFFCLFFFFSRLMK